MLLKPTELFGSFFKAIKMRQKDFNEIMSKHLADKVEQLKRLGISEIKLLEEYSDRQICIDNKKFVLAVWKSLYKDDIIPVVVQAYHRERLGFGVMMAEGFLINTAGEISQLPEHIRLEYC